MTTKIFSNLPEDAKEIRKKVFVEEQGFTVEFDDKDEIAVHLVMFDGESAVATCRIFKGSESGEFQIGRIAVIKEYRGKGLGLVLLSEAEKHIKQNGGSCIVLHAQQRAADFYKKAGFTPFGETEYDEGCPHVRMKKYLK